MVFDVEIYPEMPRKWSKAVPEGNASVPYHDEFGPDQHVMADFYRTIKERFDKSHNYLDRMKSHFDQQDGNLDELTKEMRATDNRLVGLEQDARHPRLIMEADVPSDRKTRKRTEDAAAYRTISGDSSSAQVDPDPMCLTSFGDDSTELSALLCCRDNVMVDKGTAVPKPCLSPIEMHTLTAAGGLFLAGTASTATRNIFHQPPLWLYPTEGINSRTSIQYPTTYYSSF